MAASSFLMISSSSSSVTARAAERKVLALFLPRPGPGAFFGLGVGVPGVPGTALVVRARLGVGLDLAFGVSSSDLSSSSCSGRPLRLRSSLSKAEIFFLMAPQALPIAERT
jgi:hypothetical protein